jgi:hypothetical protein
MRIEIIGDITDIGTIAVGRKIRELLRLQRIYGRGRWRKLNGVALVRVEGGEAFRAEVDWYEATGIGRKELKRELGD